MDFSKLEWIVTAIEAIERCNKARRFAYAVLVTVIIVFALYRAPDLITAIATLK
jgi:hypothetical protein